MEKCDFTDWARAANADRMLKLHVRNKIRFTAVRVQVGNAIFTIMIFAISQGRTGRTFFVAGRKAVDAVFNQHSMRSVPMHDCKKSQHKVFIHFEL